VSDQQDENSYIMTKTVFAGKKVKELTLSNSFPLLTAFQAIFPGLPENFFVGDCPRNTGNRYSQ